ncbi:hypothetical protein IT413_06485 [Candidatus Peregrinibacteria bacterium]|nr:hypothetical protein [Candidatus Peregrinibacteria bacterium]
MKPLALITGASGGIGYETESTIIIKDLSSTTAAGKIYQQLKHENMTVDVLVNNAGFGSYGKFVETDPKKQQS